MQLGAIDKLKIPGKIEEIVKGPGDIYNVLSGISQLDPDLHSDVMDTLEKLGILDKVKEIVKEPGDIYNVLSCISQLDPDLQLDVIDELKIPGKIEEIVKNSDDIYNVLSGIAKLEKNSQLEITKAIDNIPDINAKDTDDLKTKINIVKRIYPKVSISTPGGEKVTASKYIVKLIQNNIEHVTPALLIDLFKGSSVSMIGRVMCDCAATQEVKKPKDCTEQEIQQIYQNLSEYYDNVEQNADIAKYNFLKQKPWMHAIKGYELNNLTQNDIRDIFAVIASIEDQNKRNNYYKEIIEYLTCDTINVHTRFLTPAFRDCILNNLAENGVTLKFVLDNVSKTKGAKTIDDKIEAYDIFHYLVHNYYYGCAALYKYFKAGDCSYYNLINDKCNEYNVQSIEEQKTDKYIALMSHYKHKQKQQ